MAFGSRARAAGRKIAGGLAGTGLAAAGGGVYFGAQTLLTPTIYGGDQNNIPKRAWVLPVVGIIGGHMLARAPKVGAVGLGMVGGAVALGIEQIQLGMAMKANAALAPAAASNTGALLGPGGSSYELPMGENRGFETSDSGALYGANMSL